VSERVGLLGLGSNVGDRRAHLQTAVQELAAVLTVLASSSVYDTDPVGEILDQPSFLNACLQIETRMQPLELLDAVKDIELQMGRKTQAPRHSPREIDIDILSLGDLRYSDERMTVPHAQLLSRRFVLIPALELDFALQTPDGTSLAGALAELPLSEGVRWAGPPLRVAQSAK
jgi:2-amino-4-hydroxy-6-hydroxymethyldihydropteridine diphosphokinase